MCFQFLPVPKKTSVLNFYRSLKNIFLQFLVRFQSFTDKTFVSSLFMLQYLYFSSHSYYSVCQFVIYDLLCNITQHVRTCQKIKIEIKIIFKLKLNERKLFFEKLK